jgi:hypothetical protein
MVALELRGHEVGIVNAGDAAADRENRDLHRQRRAMSSFVGSKA